MILHNMILYHPCSIQHLSHSTHSPTQRYIEFNIDIEPPSLVSRILSVRDQIAQEWVKDLDTLVLANEMILDSYHEKASQQRSNETSTTETAYDRNSMFLLNNRISAEQNLSSPHRRANFDLLVLLATQESIHRVLREYREAREERESSLQWLFRFYVDRVPKYFDGDQEQGRADDFMEDLLLSSPSVTAENGLMTLVDPLRIAEEIIAMRNEVAMEWKATMEGTPSDHMDFQRLVLAARMGRMEEVQKELSSGGGSVEGAFE